MVRDERKVEGRDEGEVKKKSGRRRLEETGRGEWRDIERFKMR